MDITALWDPTNGSADWGISNGSLLVGNDLYTSVVISLFTDARAPEDYETPNGDPRGWWGDTFWPSPMGSLLWTLGRRGISDRNQLLLTAQNYCNNALAWMVTVGLAASVTTVATWLSGTMMNLAVSIMQPGANVPTIFQFSWAWASVGAGN